LFLPIQSAFAHHQVQMRIGIARAPMHLQHRHDPHLDLLLGPPLRHQLLHRLGPRVHKHLQQLRFDQNQRANRRRHGQHHLPMYHPFKQNLLRRRQPAVHRPLETPQT